MSPRKLFYGLALLGLAAFGGLAWLDRTFFVPFAIVVVLVGLGAHDLIQTSHAIRRNFPVVGRLRYVFESVRPELQQYFVESNASGRPFSRDLRSLVYQRAKNTVDTVPFGTEKDVYEPGYEWINHSLMAKHPTGTPPRVRVGGPDCTKPYDAALLFSIRQTSSVRGISSAARAPPSRSITARSTTT